MSSAAFLSSFGGFLPDAGAPLPPAFGLGGSLGDFVSAVSLAVSAALPAPLAVSVADFVEVSSESPALEARPSFDVELEAGFLPDFVGVVGAFAGVLPAAGDGAMLLDVRAVLGEVDLDDAFELSGGEALSGVGGNE